MKYSIVLGGMLLSMSVYADTLSSQQQKQIQQLIQNFKNKNIEAISQSVSYPLARENPLPVIQNQQQFQQRFSQVFDSSLQKKIATSTLADWSVMGFNGVMFGHGEVWLTDDPIIKIKAVNGSSAEEARLRQQLLKQQKAKLHVSIQKFKAPEIAFKSKDYTVRIDQLEDNKYRYVAWKNSSDQSKKPDLILNNGTLQHLGSIGDFIYSFKNGAYVYQIIQGSYVESDQDVTLLVKYNNKVIVEQHGYYLAK